MINVSKSLRLYRSSKDRKLAVKQLIKSGYNYFVGYGDSNSTHPHGLSFGKVEWVEEGQLYIKDLGFSRKAL